MKRPEYNEKTEVKVIDKERVGYGQRGVVVRLGAIVGEGKMLDPVMDKEKIRQAYADGLEPETVWEALVRFSDGEECWLGAECLEPVQHKFIDIDYIREEDLVIGKKEDGTDAVRPKNTGCFEPGDLVSITTKIDGANASIAWDETTGKLEVFSRTNLLDQPGALRGFYDYVKTEIESKLDMSKHPDLVIFGEWLVKHSINYENECYNKWYVYDIWSKKLGGYLAQCVVQGFCHEYGLEYVEELYYGPFVSWDHCRSFLRASKAYGPRQEGIVVKNQSPKLYSQDRRSPAYLKIVNEEFKESMHSKKEKKPADPEKEAEAKKAAELMEAVVTEARVRKIILKLADEGIVPAELGPKDMGTVMKHLPKRVFEDLLKEEPETVKQAGAMAGKACSAQAAKLARQIIIGK